MAKNRPTNSSDVQGIIQLIADATVGVTDLVEAMHRRIVHPPFLPSTPIQHLISGIASITYYNVKFVTKAVGYGLDKILKKLPPLLKNLPSTNEKEAVLSALNGVIGDYLEEKENPLRISMQWRYQGKTVILNPNSIKETYPTVNGKILLMVHGSCMNDIQWNHKGHHHGEALAEALNYTPIYLHYNSGRHISTNGQRLNDLLEQLLDNWPVAVTELVVVAHSMGGLVSRSAIYYGTQQQKNWTKQLKKIIFLGTPHHGAPLERAGNYIDVILEATPYVQPFARLGKIRSAGVTDLRYSNLVDEDWEGMDRFEMRQDDRKTVPLPEHAACYAIAGLIRKENEKESKLLLGGDGLVYLESALGQHKDPAKDLGFQESNTFIAYENNHMDLLSNLRVYEKIKEWLLR